MNALGLTECLRAHNGQLTPTFKNSRRGKIIHQLDHLFVSDCWQPAICSIFPTPPIACTLTHVSSREVTIPSSAVLPEWQEPEVFQTPFKSDHPRTVRYDCPLNRGRFPLYLPKPLLRSAVGEETPASLQVALEKSFQPARELGFTGRRIAPQTGSYYWGYRFY